VAGREGNKLSPISRNAWDGEPLQARSRKATSVSKYAHISAIAHVVRDELLRFLRSEDIAGGFANRHLFPLVRRSKKLPSGGNLDPNTVEQLATKTRDALDQAKKLGRLTRTPEAEALWAVMYDYLTEDVYGLYGTVVARAEAQCLRLSVAYAAVDGKSEIGVEHLAAAWELYRYCDTSARLVFGPDLTGDEVADRLLEALRDAHPNGLDGTQQSALFARHVSAERLQAARTRLEELGLVTTTEEKTGGRPRLVTCASEKRELGEQTSDLPPFSSLSSLLSLHEEDESANNPAEPDTLGAGDTFAAIAENEQPSVDGDERSRDRAATRPDHGPHRPAAKKPRPNGRTDRHDRGCMRPPRVVMAVSGASQRRCRIRQAPVLPPALHRPHPKH
jgi:hypothetical protein